MRPISHRKVIIAADNEVVFSKKLKIVILPPFFEAIFVSLKRRTERSVCTTDVSKTNGCVCVSRDSLILLWAVTWYDRKSIECFFFFVIQNREFSSIWVCSSNSVPVGSLFDVSAYNIVCGLFVSLHDSMKTS